MKDGALCWLVTGSARIVNHRISHIAVFIERVLSSFRGRTVEVCTVLYSESEIVADCCGRTPANQMHRMHFIAGRRKFKLALLDVNIVDIPRRRRCIPSAAFGLTLSNCSKSLCLLRGVWVGHFDCFMLCVHQWISQLLSINYYEGATMSCVGVRGSTHCRRALSAKHICHRIQNIRDGLERHGDNEATVGGGHLIGTGTMEIYCENNGSEGDLLQFYCSIDQFD